MGKREVSAPSLWRRAWPSGLSACPSLRPRGDHCAGLYSGNPADRQRVSEVAKQALTPDFCVSLPRSRVPVMRHRCQRYLWIYLKLLHVADQVFAEVLNLFRSHRNHQDALQNASSPFEPKTLHRGPIERQLGQLGLLGPLGPLDRWTSKACGSRKPTERCRSNANGRGTPPTPARPRVAPSWASSARALDASPSSAPSSALAASAPGAAAAV
mmetsp:Transcript_56128/g.114314  ORF Transcript_56128/g.114314 Transcript_56128/m.114314 type:complete len:213 (-) Transcript_56128:63-701(-)